MIEVLDLNHVTIVSHDVDASRRFYTGVLGMDELPHPSGFTHSTLWFRKGNAEIHLVGEPSSTQHPGDPPTEPQGERDWSKSRHLALVVADIAAAVGTLEQHGIPVVLGPRDRGDGVTQMFCYDPDGHLVELHTMPRYSERET